MAARPCAVARPPFAGSDTVKPGETVHVSARTQSERPGVARGDHPQGEAAASATPTGSGLPGRRSWVGRLDLDQHADRAPFVAARARPVRASRLADRRTR